MSTAAPPDRPRVSARGETLEGADVPADQATADCPMVTGAQLSPSLAPGEQQSQSAESKEQGESDPATGPNSQTPQRIGPFRIVRLLGEGGMGAVYLAEQSEPVRRMVALKLIHASLRKPLALARFAAERQAMARLSHPNVAQLYEAGTTADGFPYFAMEYLPGETLVQYCNQQRLDIRDRVAMFVQICQGVQHAHQKGLIHRDLKPSNLLVALVDGMAIPKIIDFGIAKAIDPPAGEDQDLTGIGAIGTPSYMSPEAFAANDDLDTRTDIYSLGIVLYELLVGVRPHDVSGAALVRLNASGNRPEAQRLTTRISRLEKTRVLEIARERGLSSHELAEHLRADLDWIVGKAIAEDRELRYATVADFSADLNRFLKNEPVEARPPSAGYRASKFVRRHRVAVAAASLVILALVLGIIGTSVGMIRAAREAEAARQVSAFLTRIFEVSDPGSARGNSVTARELLDEGARKIRTELKGQPLVEARLLRTMGGVYQNLGLYQEAEPLEQGALDLYRQTLGEDDPEVGRSLSVLGTLHNRQGLYVRAEELQRQAVALLAATTGPSSPDLAEAQMQLGLTLFLLGKQTEAELLYRRALATRESVFGMDSPEVATSLTHLGYLLNNQEHYADAEKLLARALTIRETRLGADHFQVAVSLDLLGDLYAYQGKNAQALARYQRALEIKRKVFAADHHLLAESYFALGRVYAAQGEIVEGEKNLKAGIAIVEKSLGSQHVSLSRGLQPLGMLYANQGKWREAEVTFRRLVGVYESAVGPTHHWVGEALNNLGWVLSDGLHDFVQAEQILQRAVSLFPLEAKPGYYGALSRWTLANCLRDQGREREAEPYYLEALGIFEGDGGSKRHDNPQLPELERDYAKSLRAAGRERDARAMETRSKRD